MGNVPGYMLDTSACIALLRGNPPPSEIRDIACGISTVVSNNLKHFGRVKGLEVLEWVPSPRG